MRIGEWRVDPRLDEITKDGETTKLEPRMMRLLMYLASHPGEVVSVDQLLDEVWKGVVVTPDSVYHSVAALRQALGDNSKDPTYIANVLRRGYRLIAPVEPWPDAGAQTAAPTAPGSTVSHDRPTTRARFRWGVVTVAVVLVGAIGVVAIDRTLLHRRSEPEQAVPVGAPIIGNKSIAVLPFVDLSEKKDQEYFADGMAEEILNLLARIPDLKVIGRTSSFQFKGKADDLRRIGSALGVAYVVEGSVRRSADHLRVTAQLIDTRDGVHRWSETYDRDLRDAIAMQAEIASGVASALVLEVTTLPRSAAEGRMPNSEAYDAYLRGLHAVGRFDEHGFEEAAVNFQRALDIDPTFLQAAEKRAEVWRNQADFGFVPTRTGYEQARAAAERALKLDPRAPLAHAVLGNYYDQFDYDWAAAEREFRLALAHSPNEPSINIYAAVDRIAVGDWTTASRYLDSALVRDPLFAGGYIVRSWLYVRMGRLAEAESDCRRTLEIAPTYAWGHFYLATVLVLEGNASAALSEIQKESIPNGRNAGLALVYSALHRSKEADAAITAAKDYAMGVVHAYAYRGQAEQALKWLERAYAEKDTDLALVKGDPLMKNLEGNPRYMAFVRKIRLPE